MKKLSKEGVATGITIDDKIQLDDTFADHIDKINQSLKQYYSGITLSYKPNTSDTSGLSVIADMSTEWKPNFKWVFDTINRTIKSLTYDQDKNLLSFTKPQTTTGTTTTSSTDTSDSSTTSSSSSTYSQEEKHLFKQHMGVVLVKILRRLVRKLLRL